MSFIFNNFPSPRLFSQQHFRVSYSLLPAIRRLLSNCISTDSFNVLSVACGTALEVSTLELLARSRDWKFNYVGCDINKSDLKFNSHLLKKTAPNVHQHYIHSDMASAPPIPLISGASCILWRHPEFLSDHPEVPRTLILDMCQILWNILKNKERHVPILITCYDPHEMMLVLELVQQFCEDDLQYSLTIDEQNGRASWQNPIIDPKDLDPLFNINHQDQCQLVITQCQSKSLNVNRDLFITALAKAFESILPKLQNQPSILLKHLEMPTLEVLRDAVVYLNNQIRDSLNPFIRRGGLCSVLIDDYQQSNQIQPLSY
ncbi:hypothetical protein [Legionella jamestowniensis]|uniref:Methyltransferase domain protein n=1 Tax=Legionella jamestowniensis TaxID=455 RepID=A0A0W0UTN0_9GAMM|nr:hypothetical protein [Legionella jamestowniensis]KTD11228.1 hypothetical protein Ljam_0422 [Legionella jamestowniensis]OCH98087.1 hypothetical protein A8135_13075 [Legionella jamestowniensis]SFL70288.1 hypothetical protein SAMN02746073_1493 [Legionella jamestowniensis DSM 19215]